MTSSIEKRKLSPTVKIKPVYLLPEYAGFVKLLKPRNGETIRPKWKNLQATIRLIEELYHDRYSQLKTYEDKTLTQSTVEFFERKFPKKQMVDQASLDLLASLEKHRQSSNEVETFYNFFTKSNITEAVALYL